MFSKEESKKIRQEFWIFFGKRHPRKWLLYNTKIKDLNLKFTFDTKKAQVSIDCESNDPIFKTYYYEKLLSLKTNFIQEISPQIIFDDNYTLPNGKIIARCYLQLENVSIHNKNTWVEVFDFFNEYMTKMETTFLEYKEYITS